MEEDLEIEPKEQGGESLLCQIEDNFSLRRPRPEQLSPLTLAFIGDGVYDIIIRTIIVEQGNAPVNQLHRKSSALVKASAQAELFYRVEPVLSQEELAVFKRGRNAKSATSAKNASIQEYRIATGVEALMGYLYLKNQTGRAIEIIKAGLGI